MTCTMTNEDIEILLKEIGCSPEMITTYFEYEKQKESCKQIQLLKVYRCTLLKKLHEDQKQIDDLDYLLYSMKEKCK